MPFNFWKDHVKRYAEEKYPDIWEQLKDMKQVEGDGGMVFEEISNDIQV